MARKPAAAGSVRGADRNVLAFVMAGGEGSRLHPLTANRCKPALPFGSRHSIVDFVLSNLANSEIRPVYLLVQHQAQALAEHVRRSWLLDRAAARHALTVVPPQARHGPAWFRGTADAVYQNIHLIEALRPDLVAVFCADHVCRMDVRQMIEFHVASGAHASVATIPVALRDCAQFGIVDLDDSHRIVDFKEKPRHARPMPGSRTHALASMGNYIFDADVLLRQLERMHARGETDFGQHVLPAMVHGHKLVAYDFATNAIAGAARDEEPAYWRDVGTIDAYFQAQFDTLGARPRLRVDNPHWPIHASLDPAGPAQIESATINRCVIGPGGIVDGATLDHAILRRRVMVEPGTLLEHCIVMERTRIGRGARVRRAIIDRDNDIPPGERIGFDLEQDRQRFHVTASGIVVVPAGTFAAREAAAFPPRSAGAARAVPA